MDVHDMNHEYIRLAILYLEALNETHTMGKFWIDYFPFLKNIPGWLPGVHFQRYGRLQKPIMDMSKRKPFDDIRRAVVCVFLRI